MFSVNPLTLLGLLGMLSFMFAAYFNYLIYSRLRDNKETTLEYFFLRDQIRTSLRALIVGNIVFVLSSGVSIFGIYSGNLLVSQAFRVGSAALFITYMAFFLSLAIWTRPEGLHKFKWLHNRD